MKNTSYKNNIDIYHGIQILKKYKLLLIYSFVIIFTFSLLYIIFSPKLYRSYISIYRVESGSGMSNSLGNLQGIASTFGFNFGGANNSSFYIPDVINSRTLKRAIIQKKWNSEKFKEPVDLISYWEINKENKINKILRINKKSNNPLEYINNLEQAIELLSNRMFVKKEDSGLIIAEVFMEESKLSADIVNFVGDFLSNYLKNHLNVQSNKHREFIEERLNTVKIELSNSEDLLTQFRKNNPIVHDTPKLQLERGRLIRNVEVNQQVYITIRQQFEVAKIEELKDAQVLNVLDSGQVDTKIAKPRKFMILLVTLILYVLIMLSTIYIHEFKDKLK